MMRWAHRYLRVANGLSFYKLLGSGSGDGFRPGANLSVYGVLSVWQTEADAERFFAESRLYDQYRQRSAELWQLYLHPIKVRGVWDGQNPFGTGRKPAPDALTAVITRATIRRSQLLRFWREVPPVSRSLTNHPGMICSLGVGEWPLVQMATFSIWKNTQAMQAYAYHSQAHQQAITDTRRVDWFSEEMYARFQPFRSEGQWGGVNPLANYGL
jgi:heme-degrading monooxygenase HmoA